MWNHESLHEHVSRRLRNRLLVVVSNREPYVHTYDSGELRCEAPPGGVTSALDPVMRACGGVWIACGSGHADRATVDARSRVPVPPADPRYTLKRVWLSKEEENGHYHGFSNDALWPLCHVAYTRPTFKEPEWNTYKAVNQRFAEAVLDEIGNRKAFVFIQDYHLALLPRLLREAAPNVIVAHFWHLPWPNREVFRICPWQDEILDGLLGSHLLGFHIRYHCNNFLDTVDRGIEARVDWERYEVTRGEKTTRVRPFPVSIDYDSTNDMARGRQVTAEMDRLRKSLGIDGCIVGMGLDRIDYTKGIADRIRALDRFLERFPEYRNRVVFVLVGVPSRVHLSAYRKTNDEIDGLIEQLNRKYQSGRWRPIIHLRGPLPGVTVMALRRLADFAVVSSLHDGMNLASKEFVASRFDEDGVLVLSRFTGASRELTDAIQVNPYATDQFAEAIKTAIEMPPAERQGRMRRMRAVVRENNVFKWAADIVDEIEGLRGAAVHRGRIRPRA